MNASISNTINGITLIKLLFINLVSFVLSAFSKGPLAEPKSHDSGEQGLRFPIPDQRQSHCQRHLVKTHHGVEASDFHRCKQQEKA